MFAHFKGSGQMKIQEIDSLNQFSINLFIIGTFLNVLLIPHCVRLVIYRASRQFVYLAFKPIPSE